MPAEYHPTQITDSELDVAMEFWDDVILNVDGTVNMRNVYAELYDYEILMENASSVFYHVTCGKMSQPNYLASAVIQQSDECVEDTIRREVLDVLTSIESAEHLQELIKEYSDE
jgi:hypothetical protein